MARLIDATRIEQYILNNCSDNEEINAIYAEIINAPTVDAVEVVRCKDCKYCGRVDKRRFYRGSDCLNNHIDTIVIDKDYCSRYERREE